MAASPDEVQNSIDKAEKYLYSHEKGGNWEGAKKSKKLTSPAQDEAGGMTVTAAYALLSAGENLENAKLAAAINYLKATDFTGIYTLGMRCQLWRMLLPNPDIKQKLRADGEALQKSISTDTGMYDVRINSTASPADNSVSQYGVLGVWACTRGDGDSHQLLAKRRFRMVRGSGIERKLELQQGAAGQGTDDSYDCRWAGHALYRAGPAFDGDRAVVQRECQR